jgi:polysaccharide pyruvyl transferase WcaK-like protein
MSDEIHSRRRGKVVWFIVAETGAVMVLLVAGTFVLLARPVDSAVMTALNVVMLAAAAGVATIPIFFFAFAPILPRSGR